MLIEVSNPCLSFALVTWGFPFYFVFGLFLFLFPPGALVWFFFHVLLMTPEKWLLGAGRNNEEDDDRSSFVTFDKHLKEDSRRFSTSF